MAGPARILAVLPIAVGLAAGAAFAQTAQPTAGRLGDPGSIATTPLRPGGAADADAGLPTGLGEGELGTIDRSRFGARPEDVPFSFYQIGRFKTARDLARPLAEQGNPAAQTLLAEIYAGGLGTARDPRQAAAWYARAAEAGEPNAQFQYALLLLEGTLVEKNETLADRLLRQASDAGNELATFNLAQRLIQKGTPDAVQEAETLYRLAAEARVPDAQYAYAQFLSGAVDGITRDAPLARDYLSQAARAGMSGAKVELATWLFAGEGGPRDLERGFRLLREAASGGNVAGQNRLAKAYYYGMGTDADTVEAAVWYIRAKRAGLTDPELESMLRGLSVTQMQSAIERANRP